MSTPPLLRMRFGARHRDRLSSAIPNPVVKRSVRLVDDEQSHVLQRREDGAAGADDRVGSRGAGTPARRQKRSRSEGAELEHRHAQAERRFEAARRLRHRQNIQGRARMALPPSRTTRRIAYEVGDERLSAAGNAVEQHLVEGAALEQVGNWFQRNRFLAGVGVSLADLRLVAARPAQGTSTTFTFAQRTAAIARAMAALEKPANNASARGTPVRAPTNATSAWAFLALTFSSRRPRGSSTPGVFARARIDQPPFPAQCAAARQHLYVSQQRRTIADAARLLGMTQSAVELEALADSAQSNRSKR